jgi:hypothetical protein
LLQKERIFKAVLQGRCSQKLRTKQRGQMKRTTKRAGIVQRHTRGDVAKILELL